VQVAEIIAQLILKGHFPIFDTSELIGIFIKKNGLAWEFWDLLGFADYIIAERV
jgi:hypothetical protein